MGPLLFNIFINDIFYFIEHGTLYNYADDNSLSYADQDYNTLINVLEKESSILIEWFNFNCMQANPVKFQAIAVGKKTYAKEPVFNIESANYISCEVVKLLCINIDYQLNFDKHIKNICRIASQQLSVLKSDTYKKYRGQVIIPTAHYSDSPLLRRPIIPTAHCSDSPFLRQPIIPSKMVKSSIIILKPVVFLLYLTED